MTTKINIFIIEKAIKKASQSPCKIRVSALGFNKDGACVATSTNKPRFKHRGGGYHAEEILMSRAAKIGIVRILICRIGKGGDLLPIDPCSRCQELAIKTGVKIETIPTRN